MQTKKVKQHKALTILLHRLQNERESRESIQCQSFRLIDPSRDEMRLSHEIYNLKVNLNLLQSAESAF